MINKERFEEIAGQAESKGLYACGYRNICWEHACPCRAGMEEFNEDVYKAIQQEAQEVAEEFTEVDYDEIDYGLSDDKNDVDFDEGHYWD